MKHTENIERLIRTFCIRKRSAVKTTAELDERIVRDAVLVQKTTKTEPSAAMWPGLWRMIMQSRMTKYAAGAVIVFVMIVGIVEFGKPIGASTVFAAAMDNIRKARTFSCIEIFEVSYKDDDKSGSYLLKQKWMFREPDLKRHEKLTSPWPQYVGEVTISNYGTRQELSFRPAEKTARLRDLVSDYAIDSKTGELKQTQLNTRLRDRILEWSAGAVEDLGNVKLDGQIVRMLQSRHDNRITTVWIDPQTNDPVQVEHTWTDESRSPVIITEIQIDVGLDDKLFSLEAPEDYALSVEEPGWPDDKRKLMTKVMHLGLLCVIYAGNNDNRFPVELADLVTSGAITEEALNRVLASPDDPDGPPVIRYRKPDSTADWSTEVTLYEMYDQWPDDGVIACFMDGHSELITDQNRFEELIK
jgi:hypothetical protein